MKKLLFIFAAFAGIILMTQSFEKTTYARNTYTITTSTVPCNKTYRKSKKYTSYTKNYYTLRSYTEKLQKEGGGTLFISAGTYKLTNTIYIPSNTTIIFEDGVTINHIEKTGTKKLKPSNTMFQFVEPKYKKKKKRYNGVHDVAIIGNNTTLNCGGQAMAFVLGHNRDIDISGLSFINMRKDKHLIELNSSKNVTITNCIFDANTANKSGKKECINIDYDYKKGFNNKWASHDKTHCTEITIENCTFMDAKLGVGSHYNNTNKYHTDIEILNCSFGNIKNGWIKGLHWKDVTLSALSDLNDEELSIAAAKEKGLLPSLSLSEVEEK